MTRLTIFLVCILLATSSLAQKDDQPYNFPVKPGSTKWQSFKSVEEMYRACQVPNDTLNVLTTKALLETCLNYPAPSVLLIHNTPQQGFEEWKRNFNGIKELLARQDVQDVLINLYQAFDVAGHQTLKGDVEAGKYTFLLQRIEAIIVQDEIINGITELQKKQLFNAAFKKYNSIEADSVYGFSNLESSGRIILKMMETSGSKSVKQKIENNEIQHFLKTGILKDRQSFLQIIQQIKNENANR